MCGGYRYTSVCMCVCMGGWVGIYMCVVMCASVGVIGKVHVPRGLVQGSLPRLVGIVDSYWTGGRGHWVKLMLF